MYRPRLLRIESWWGCHSCVCMCAFDALPHTVSSTTQTDHPDGLTTQLRSHQHGTKKLMSFGRPCSWSMMNWLMSTTTSRQVISSPSRPQAANPHGDERVDKPAVNCVTGMVAVSQHTAWIYVRFFFEWKPAFLRTNGLDKVWPVSQWTHDLFYLFHHSNNMHVMPRIRYTSTTVMKNKKNNNMLL